MSKSSETTAVASGGLGLPGVLFVVFLVLKLCGVIDWSWWWVTAPLWIPIGGALTVALLAGLIGVACIVAAAVLEGPSAKRK